MSVQNRRGSTQRDNRSKSQKRNSNRSNNDQRQRQVHFEGNLPVYELPRDAMRATSKTRVVTNYFVANKAISAGNKSQGRSTMEPPYQRDGAVTTMMVRDLICVPSRFVTYMKMLTGQPEALDDMIDPANGIDRFVNLRAMHQQRPRRDVEKYEFRIEQKGQAIHCGDEFAFLALSIIEDALCPPSRFIDPTTYEDGGFAESSLLTRTFSQAAPLLALLPSGMAVLQAARVKYNPEYWRGEFVVQVNSVGMIRCIKPSEYEEMEAQRMQKKKEKSERRPVDREAQLERELAEIRAAKAQQNQVVMPQAAPMQAQPRQQMIPQYQQPQYQQQPPTYQQQVPQYVQPRMAFQPPAPPRPQAASVDSAQQTRQVKVPVRKQEQVMRKVQPIAPVPPHQGARVPVNVPTYVHAQTYAAEGHQVAQTPAQFDQLRERVQNDVGRNVAPVPQKQQKFQMPAPISKQQCRTIPEEPEQEQEHVVELCRGPATMQKEQAIMQGDHEAQSQPITPITRLDEVPQLVAEAKDMSLNDPSLWSKAAHQYDIDVAAAKAKQEAEDQALALQVHHDTQKELSANTYAGVTSSNLPPVISKEMVPMTSAILSPSAVPPADAVTSPTSSSSAKETKTKENAILLSRMAKH